MEQFQLIDYKMEKTSTVGGKIHSFRQSTKIQNNHLQLKSENVPRYSQKMNFERLYQISLNYNRNDELQYNQTPNAFRKKQLRRDSTDNLTINNRDKIFSTYNNFSQSQKEYKTNLVKQNVLTGFFQKKIGLNQQIPQFLNFNKPQINFKAKQKISFRKTAQFSDRQNLLNWGKTSKKKARRNTGLIQYSRGQNIQQSMDGKKQINLTISFENSLYINNSLGSLQTKNQHKNQNKFANSLQLDFELNRSSPVRPQKQSKLIKRSDFDIGKRLGQGNFGQVFLAVHKLTGFVCALKIMKKEKIKRQKYQGQIAREISIQSFLKHPNVVQHYGVFQDYLNIYLLLQYCQDGHLYGLIKKNMRIQQQETSNIIKGISQGVDYIHRQAVIHRDIKPQNIFLNFGVPKLGDFGWAVYMGKDGSMRRTSSGSPLYYSPQMVNKQQYDQKIDIWGLGVVAYQCLIGMVPFKVYSFLNLNKIVNDQLSFPSYVQISKQSQDFITKCLKKNPQQRMSIQQVLKHSFIKHSSQ